MVTFKEQMWKEEIIREKDVLKVIKEPRGGDIRSQRNMYFNEEGVVSSVKCHKGKELEFSLEIRD